MYRGIEKLNEKTHPFTSEEQALNKAIDDGRYVSALSSAEKKRYAKIAEHTFQKQRTVNVRISERNLLRLKAAAREGVSYQTLVTALIQKNV